MTTRKANIKTIADFNRGDENDSPNVRTILNQPSSSSSSYRATTDVNNRNNNNSSSNNSIFNPKVYHIPKLHNDEYAKQLLHRVVQEFLPILQRRQYNVISISELCCCNDGLDFQHEHDAKDGDNPHNNTKNNIKKATNAKRRRRKIRKVADNIWGYNRTSFTYDNNNRPHNRGKQHTIHIRLRHTNDHTKFLLYEDVAGTLAHELTHCERGPHDATFFKLMDDILEDHANLMYNGSHHTTMSAKTTITATTTPFSGEGQKLGSGQRPRLGSGTISTNPPTGTHSDEKGQVLGGDRTFVQWMTPKDAAVIAAETRRRQQLLRLRGDHDCCRPCYDDDDDDDDDNNQSSNSEHPNDAETVVKSTVVVAKRSKVKPQQQRNETKRVVPKNEMGVSSHNTGRVVNVVDLTTCELDDDDDNMSTKYSSNNNSNKEVCDATTRPVLSPWSCHCCTYRNRPLALTCDMCCTTKQISTVRTTSEGLS